MDNTLIYLEWESKPFIKEELAERIMQEAAGKDEKLFSDFKDEYEDTDFIGQKHKTDFIGQKNKYSPLVVSRT